MLWIPLDPWRDENPFGSITPPPPEPRRRGHWEFLPRLFLAMGRFTVFYWALVQLAEALKAYGGW